MAGRSTKMKAQPTLNLAGVIAMTAMTAGVASAQYTGTSHPDDMTITTAAPTVAIPGAATPGAMPDPSAAGSRSLTSAPMPVDRYAAPAEAVPAIPFRAGVAGTAVDPYATSLAPSAVPANVVATGTPAPVLNAPGPRAMAAARADEDSDVVVRVAGPSDRLPEGTLIKARLRETLSTKRTPEGSEWTAELIEPLERDGQVLIPAGSLLRGKVTEVRGGKRIHGQAEIHLTTLSMTLPDGAMRGMHAQVIDTELNHALRVDREGTILHRDHRKEEGGILALTVGTGAAVGSVFGGAPGALIGAGVGAGVSGVMYLKEDKQAELPKDTVVTFELTRSLGFSPE